MPDLIIIVLLVPLGLFALFVLIDKTIDISSWWAISSIMLMWVLIGWLSFASFLPWQIDDQKFYISRTVDDTDLIIMNGGSLNLNRQFGKRIKDGTKIKITTHKKWAGGIYWMEPPPIDYEIVEDLPERQ